MAVDSSSEEMGVAPRRGLLIALTELEAGEFDPPASLSLLCMIGAISTRLVN